VDVLAVLIIMAGLIAMDTTSGPQVLISEPVVTCSLLGLVFGMPLTGLKLGVFFQLLWLGYLPLGAARLTDGNMGSFISAAGLFAATGMVGPDEAVLRASMLPAMLFGMVAAYLGMHLTHTVRAMNGRRNERLFESIERGESVSIAGTHFIGVASSFLRGVVMAMVLIPAGAVLFAMIPMLPEPVLGALACSSLLMFGMIAASALVFFWFKGMHRYIVFGAFGGIVWILYRALIPG